MKEVPGLRKETVLGDLREGRFSEVDCDVDGNKGQSPMGLSTGKIETCFLSFQLDEAGGRSEKEHLLL